MASKILVMPDPGVQDPHTINLIETLDMRLINPCNLTSFLVDETITRHIHKCRNGLDQFMGDSLKSSLRTMILGDMYHVMHYQMDPDEFESMVDDDVETVLDLYPALSSHIVKQIKYFGDLGEGDAHINILHGMPSLGSLLIQMEDAYG